MSCTTLLCLLAVAQRGGDLPTPEELLAGTRRRAEACVNLKFEYTVRATYWPSDKPGQKVWVLYTPITHVTRIETRESLKILASNRRDSPWPWLCWTRSVQDRNGTWALDYFAWDRGSDCGMYVRKSELEEGHLYVSTGQVSPGRGPILFAENYFKSLLACDLYGLDYTIDADWHSTEQHMLHGKWRLVRQTVRLDRATYVLAAKCKNEHVDGYWEVWVTGPPEYLVVRREARFADCREPSFDEVTSIKYIDGFAYAATGRLVQPPHGVRTRQKYEFEVTSVERLTEADRKAWRPKWPAGTYVHDQIKGTYYKVPYPPAREQALRRALGMQQPPVPTAAGKSRSPIFLFNLAMLLVFVAALLIYRHKRRRARAAGRVEP
jgi:hypothetical protein